MFGEDSNFDNFDPAIQDSFNGFDSGQTAVQQRQPAYFDLRFVSTANVALTVELFNQLRSFAKILNANYVVANFAYTPFATSEGATVGQNVIWMQNGDLRITSAADASGHIVLSCSTFPYRGLLESSNVNPFRITRIRMTTTTDAQIDNNIVHFSNSFVGGNTTNSINPRTYFNPSQFQGKIVDIPLNLVIDQQKGLQYIINAGETVQWNVQVEAYKLNTV